MTRVSPPDADVERLDRDVATVFAWLRDYVAAPSPWLGRRGAVCPFMPPALGAGSIELSVHYGVDACDGAALTGLLVAELRAFAKVGRPTHRSGVSLRSHLVVLPDAREPGWRRLDECYRGIKDLAVDAGLMVGQFHPACAEPAVHNPGFPVSRAPMALLAIRHMAPHDVLFLERDRVWLRQYEARFAEHPARLRALPDEQQRLAS